MNPTSIRVAREARNPQSGNFFQIPGLMQSRVPPRFSNAQYGANIRYKLPESDSMAFDVSNPMAQGQMVADTRASSVKLKTSKKTPDYVEASDMLPVSDLMAQNLMGGGDDGDKPPIIYDRFIYANQRSRLKLDSDYIRGDIPITPMATGWFRPSATPHLDLNSGAMGVLGGLDNQTNQQMLALRSASSSGGVDTGSGVNFAVEKSQYASPAGDINVTAFL
jgi:hypothetical protein